MLGCSFKAMPDRTLVLGAIVALAMFALSVYVFGFVAALLFGAWLFISRLVILHLLQCRSALAKGLAVVLMLNVIFLFFLPKHIRNGIEALKNAEAE